MRVTYWMEVSSPKLENALEFLVATGGYSPQKCDDPHQATLYYGNNARGNPVIIPHRSSDASSPPQSIAAPEPGRPFASDIVAASAALLTDELNGEVRQLDPFDRIPFEASFQAKGGHNRASPTVNLYVHVLKSALESVIGPGIGLWPDGKSSAIGLSHDVDRLDRWSVVRGLWKGHFTAGAKALAKIAVYRHHDGDLLLELGEHERSFGFKSTFMFAAYNRYETAQPLDVTYSIESPYVKQLMRQLLHQGHEIGLHASFDCYKSVENFRREKQRLEDAIGTAVLGLRHHFWHLGKDPVRTLKHHQAAGFLYDSSLAFNEHAGFRRSTAVPFYPWDSAENKPIPVLQLPVCAMDGNYFYRKGMTVSQCMEELIPMLEEFEALGGMGVIDWHSDTSHPGTNGYTEWGRAYFELLATLKQRPSRWVTCLGEIATWTRQRDERIGWAVKRPSIGAEQ